MANNTNNNQTQQVASNNQAQQAQAGMPSEQLVRIYKKLKERCEAAPSISMDELEKIIDAYVPKEQNQDVSKADRSCYTRYDENKCGYTVTTRCNHTGVEVCNFYPDEKIRRLIEDVNDRKLEKAIRLKQKVIKKKKET